MTNEQILRKALAELSHAGKFSDHGDATKLAERIRSMRSHARQAINAANAPPDDRLETLGQLVLALLERGGPEGISDGGIVDALLGFANANGLR